MAAFTFSIIIFFFFSSCSIFIEAYNPSNHCSNGPHIQSPFRIKGGQTPQNDSLFDVVCRDNSTIIHFPSYGDLVIKSISYDTQRLDLLDPKSCVHRVFLDLDLSQTTFSYYYLVKNYTYLNCTDRLSSVLAEVIPCLSGSGHYVYTVEPSMAVPKFCTKVKTIAIPFGYSPYLADNSFGLSLTWSFLGGQEFDGKEGFIVGHVQVLSIGVFVFAIVAALVFMTRKIYYSKKLVPQEEKANHQIEVEKFLGDYKAFSTGEAYIDKVSNQC
ncbi:hypothetical protein PanWU01x14_122790 [Parasponia andersonii]|uniref:RING-type E3 ubiquitin transferase n=1 Tax=Parasponia andersonii TaxID=3476 RepID=A0A2P5CU38_PARAD|nr:hypothetical protein PanWU01x14_122790 [Parasponia andersonii]